MSDYENVLVAVDDGIATVTVNRPKVLNALDAATILEITACFEALRDDDAVRGIIVTGAGDKAFVAGADIGELVADGPIEAKRTAERGGRMCRAIESVGKPVIAAINGFALGGGCELALACTLRTAADSAKIGLPEVTLGIMPGYGGTQRLPRLVGKGRALEMILTGAPVDAAAAERMGLVNRVFPADDLLAETAAWLRKILRNGPLALRLATEAVERGLGGSLDEGLGVEADLFGVIAASKDRHEGLTAFLEKRRPEYKDE